ncbi:MAG: [protein-PII] uridylyltransferase family protein [Armatimonadota bacterium]
MRELGEKLKRERERIFAHTSRGLATLAAASDLLDGAVCRIARAALSGIPGDPLSGVAIAATGGYGRREISPFSDVDIAFIVEDEDNPQIDALVKSAYRLLMDTLLDGANLKVGYSYRPMNDCHDLPLEVQTALLDARPVTGSPLLFERFYASMLSAISPASFVFGHIAAREHSGDSLYSVEPEIKEGCGGLRDLQAARWIAQVAFRVKREEVWEALRARGVLSDSDVKQIGVAAEFLARVRIALHAAAGRETNRLSIDRQDEVATKLGYTRGAPALMERYYAHAEQIRRTYRRIVDACRAHPLEVEPGLVVTHGEIHMPDRSLFSRDAEAVIRVFEHVLALGVGIDPDTARAVSGHASGRKRAGGDAAEAFLRVLALPGAEEVLPAMSELGILRWLLPEFGRLMHIVPGDAAHEFTVGAHSLAVARRIGSFRSGDLAGIYKGVSRPEVLLLAGLLHDSGKAESGPHQETGARIAASAGERLGLDVEAVGQLEFLVRQHLSMAETARLRDVNQPKTVSDFVSTIDSTELLDMLYLLTAADISSVGQATWSEVQMNFLRELYNRADTALRVSTEVDMERHRGRIARELSIANLPPEEVDEHCRAMPAAYLLSTPPDRLAAHITYVRQARAGKPVVRLEDDPSGRFTEITACTPNEKGLLARIAGVLAALGVEIHAAQVFTRESTDKIAIDTLYVDFSHHALSQTKRLFVQTELEKALLDGTSVETLLARFGKKLKKNVSVHNLLVMSHLSDMHTVIEVEADDAPGLLYRLTSVIASLGWDIHSARVSTWGQRARDAFYVTDAQGEKLDESAGEVLAKALE